MSTRNEIRARIERLTAQIIDQHMAFIRLVRAKPVDPDLRRLRAELQCQARVLSDSPEEGFDANGSPAP